MVIQLLRTEPFVKLIFITLESAVCAFKNKTKSHNKKSKVALASFTQWMERWLPD